MNCGDVINAAIGARIGDDNDANPADSMPDDLLPCAGVPAIEARRGDLKVKGDRNGEPACAAAC